jgi:hypothetical protein
LRAKRSIGLFVEHELGEAITIAEVDKSHTAHFARALHPSTEGDTLANFAQAEFATIVGSIHVACANFVRQSAIPFCLRGYKWSVKDRWETVGQTRERWACTPVNLVDLVAMAPVCLYAKVIFSLQKAKWSVNNLSWKQEEWRE